MNKKNLLFGAMAVLTLAACSNDETIVEKVDANKISYSVSAEGNTRADAVYCSNKLMNSFTVYASTDGKAYINGDVITLSGKNTVTSERYWPESEVNFYAVSNNEAGSFTFNVDKASEVTFNVNGDVASQKDLLYAATKATKPTNSIAKLNFRHALSQIVFKARKESKNMHIVIKSVAVGGVATNGVYQLPFGETTDINMAHPAPGVYQEEGRGEWSTIEGKTTYTVSGLDATVPYAMDSKDALALTVGSEATDFSKAMLLIPQHTEQFNPNAEGTSLTKDGTYLLVDVEIYNVAGDEFDAANDVQLYSGLARIPVAFNWEEGYCYIYTLIFGRHASNGGTIPGDGPEDPVLQPITYEVSVDEFMEAGNFDVAPGADVLQLLQ